MCVAASQERKGIGPASSSWLTRGTLLLDEVGELPLPVQAKLLRVLQRGEIQRVGNDGTQLVDVRIIAVTNRDLRREVAEGRFREDLYHRLSVYLITVPPLREQEHDVTLLAGCFMERCARKLGLRALRLNSAARRWLIEYAWPGNVRELEHAISRASVRAENFKRRLIGERLRANDDNVAATARSLGVDRGNLYRQAKRLGLR